MEYKKKSLLRKNGEIYRVLDVREVDVLTINCSLRLMPCWHSQDEFSDSDVVTEEELLQHLQFEPDALASYDAALANKRFAVISE